MISQRMLKQLGQLRREEFVHRLGKYLYDSYADRVKAASFATVCAFADMVSKRATQWGFRTESDIAEIAMLVLEIRMLAGIQTEPEWFSSIIADTTLTPQVKVYQLVFRWQKEMEAMQGQLRMKIE